MCILFPLPTDKLPRMDELFEQMDGAHDDDQKCHHASIPHQRPQKRNMKKVVLGYPYGCVRFSKKLEVIRRTNLDMGPRAP